MRTLKELASVLFLSISISSSGVATASVAAVDSWGAANSYVGGPWTIGYQFSANVNADVLSLGVFDPDGVTNPTTVSLWTDAGVLLASTVVSQSDQLLGSFRYASLNGPVVLNAGQTYRIGVGVANSADWLYEVKNVVTNPSISYLHGTWSNGNNVFTDHVNLGGTNDYISANLLIAAVPEPESYAMLMAGLGLLGGIARRRLQQ